MNIDELLQIIARENLERPVIYDEGNLQDGTVVLKREGDMWQVYIANERGGMHESTFKTFDKEADALEHVLLKLRQGRKMQQSMEAMRERRLNQESTGAKKDQIVSQAIIEYLQKGHSAYPKRRESFVTAFAANVGVDPEALLAKVKTITAECASIEIDWTTHSLVEGGKEAERVMLTRHPELEEDAIKALIWMFTYMWR